MRYQIRKDRQLRRKYKKNEERHLILKALQVNSYITEDFNKNVKIALDTMTVKKTRIINRCTVTGRKHGILSKFKISRLEFKERAQEGKIEGVKKSSW